METDGRQTSTDIVTQYRRLASSQPARAPATLELEIRFQAVDFESFSKVLEAANAGKIGKPEGPLTGPGAGAPQVSHTINTIREQQRHGGRREGGGRPLRSVQIRQITYENWVKAGDTFFTKHQLVPPQRVSHQFALAYNVTLSEEKPSKTSFSADEGAVIRIRARASFPVILAGATGHPLRWRLDLTIIRQLTSADAAASIHTIVDTMFRRRVAMTPTNMLQLLELENNEAAQRLYQYEIEAEYLGELRGVEDTPVGGVTPQPPARTGTGLGPASGAPGEPGSAAQAPRAPEKKDFGELEPVGDPIRSADITAMADAVLHHVSPEYLEESAYQAEVHRVASHIVASASLLEQFRHKLGLKDLLPPVVPLTRAEYFDIFPPAGHYLTDKADGVRAVAYLGGEGRCTVLADKRYDFALPGEQKARRDRGVPAITLVEGELVTRRAPQKAEAPTSKAPASKAPAKKPGERGVEDLVIKNYTPQPPTMTFYAFDVLAVAGESLVEAPFEARLEAMPAALSRLQEAVSHYAEIAFAAKTYVHLGSTPQAIHDAVRELTQREQPYETDGLILVEPGKPYRDTVTRKWKPLEHMTIDFLARRAPRSVVAAGKAPFADKPGHKLYFLFVGITPEDFSALGLQHCPGYQDLFGGGRQTRDDRWNAGSYFPIQFSPSDAPQAYLYQHPEDSPLGDIDQQVVEARCRGGCAAAGSALLVDWELVRTREDRRRELLARRYFGNNFRIAELTWINYLSEFRLEELWEGPEMGYFREAKSGAYRAQTAVVSFVKTRGIAQLSHARCVIDYAIGHGQDLGRYFEAGIHQLIGVDRDRAALMELVKRKWTFAKQSRAPGRHRAAADSGAPRKNRGTAVHVLVADLLEPYGATLEKVKRAGMPEEGADAVVCNLAVHYFAEDPAALKNFVVLCRSSVQVGGSVRLTTMAGGRVHELLQAEKVQDGGAWDAREGEALKYSIRRLYSGQELAPSGQRIGVLLPFSSGQYYDEYLVNVEYLTKLFVERGFRRASFVTLDAFLSEFGTREPSLAHQLTAADKRYLGLYCELVFAREK